MKTVRHLRGRWRLALAAAALGLAACGGGSGDPIPPFDSASDVVVADLDGDGLNDLALAVAYLDGPPPHPGRVRVWRQVAGAPGTFVDAGSHAVGPDPWRLRAVDVDGDGRLDLLAMSSHTSAVDGVPVVDVLTVLRADPARPGGFRPGVTLHAGVPLSGLAVADFDGDGAVDIAYTGAGTRLGLWWNDPAAPGQFADAVTLVAGGGALPVAADLDHDGRIDLAYTTVDGVVRGLLRDPAAPRAFLPPRALATGSLPSCLAAADLDRDGRTDLVLGSRATADFGAPGELLTWRNDPQQPGRFLPLQALPLPVHAGDCVATDLDGDGAPDLLTTGAGHAGQMFDDLLAVFLAIPGGAGRLHPGVVTVTADTASGFHVAAGDLDGDGRPDVAMPVDGGVLLLRADPARTGVLLRWQQLR